MQDSRSKILRRLLSTALAISGAASVDECVEEAEQMVLAVAHKNGSANDTGWSFGLSRSATGDTRYRL